MALKDILIHLDASEASDRRLDIGADLAARTGAHLTGLFVAEIGLPPTIVGDPGGGAATVLIEQMRNAALADGERVEAEFRERLRRDGFSGEWRMVEGFGTEIVPLHARCADLTVLGQQDPDGPGTTGAILEAALLDSGRPVLAVPYAQRAPRLGPHALVAWNGSREAARAVADALPLLAMAERVTVLVVLQEEPRSGEDAVPGDDIALHLARHGITVTATRMMAPEIEPGEALLNAAAEHAADFLVMGGYGHSRLREMIMGGVTRTLLRSMTLPVLMSH